MAPVANLIVGLVVVGLVAWAVWPQVGLLARVRRANVASKHVAREDLLKAVLKAEAAGRPVTIDSLAGATGTSRDQIAGVLQELQSEGLMTLEDGVPTLLQEGRESALHIVRAHRIWERHLADRTGIEEELWHDEAERVEHRLSPEDVRDLSAELGHPTVDPHGDPIPPEGADLWTLEGVAITKLDSGDRGTIVHVEDEPPAVYAQLVAERLSPGMTVYVVGKTAERIHFWADGNEVTLAPIVAANLTVRLEEKDVADEPESTIALSDLEPGQTGRVKTISRSCRGQTRRRLLDLGVVPGTLISVEREAPGGDPIAYRIRGATIALRNAQARMIQLENDREKEPQRN